MTEECPTCGAGRNEETDGLYTRVDALEAKNALLSAALNNEYRQRMILCVAMEEILRLALRATEDCEHG